MSRPTTSYSGQLRINGVDQNIVVLSDMSDKAETLQHHVHSNFHSNLVLIRTSTNKLVTMLTMALCNPSFACQKRGMTTISTS